MYHNRVSLEAYRNADPLSDPLTLFDTAPVADGAAALILTLPEVPAAGIYAPRRCASPAPAWSPTAWRSTTVQTRWHSMLPVVRSKEPAGRQVSYPADVDLFELYDSYSIYAALALEAAGFTNRGEGWKLAQDGKLGTGW